MLASRWGLNASHLQYNCSSQGGNSFHLEMCMCFGSSPRQSQMLASGMNLKLKSKACYAGLSFHSTGNAAVDLKTRTQLSAVMDVGGWKRWGNSSGEHWTFPTTVPCQVYFAASDRGLELTLIISHLKMFIRRTCVSGAPFFIPVAQTYLCTLLFCHLSLYPSPLLLASLCLLSLPLCLWTFMFLPFLEPPNQYHPKKCYSVSQII